MRARDFILEDVQQDLESELQNILINYKGKGAGSVQTQSIVRLLSQAGYSISVHGLLSTINNMPMVVSADENNIRFVDSSTEGNSSSTTSSVQDSAEAVRKMAKAAAKKGL